MGRHTATERKTMDINAIPRPEYPRPQFVRQAWENLNGPWSYVLDHGKSGMQRGYAASKGFPGAITVPFCPESVLSGVGHTDFIEMMWYHRKLTVPALWAGQRIILHFGGVDWESELFIDGASVGRHYGGISSFSYDITPYVTPGQTHDLVLYVRDDTRSGNQPGGKQCPDYASRRCHYTRTTGIWQTVWMEPVPTQGLRDVYVVPDLDQGRFIVTPRFFAVARGQRFRVTVIDGPYAVATETVSAADGVPCAVSVPEAKTWSPASPFLYTLRYEVLDAEGKVTDMAHGYAGMRKVHIEGNRVYLNNEPIYLRLVLDQGFYPDGIWTAPDDAALKRDIELSMRAGFNGARLHQKVFEERFHYWADKLGYLTWGESSSWGIDVKDAVSARNFLAEWREILIRDRNHPSIIAWTPLNETRDVGDRRQHNRLHIDAYELAHDLDPTRPVNDASGYAHARTDLWTVHTYEQDPAKLADKLKLDAQGKVWRCFPDSEIEYFGQPYLVDEFGGIKWVPNQERVWANNSWGYGEGPKSLEEFYARLEGQIEAILAQPHICGYCYTQLTDVEQEQNGVYFYDRSDKFDMDLIRELFSREPKG
jgi:hypothetical protein